MVEIGIINKPKTYKKYNKLLAVLLMWATGRLKTARFIIDNWKATNIKIGLSKW